MAKGLGGWAFIIGLILIFMLIGIILFQKFYKKKTKNPLSDLTLQERKIFILLQQGKSNKEIADECSISISTVKSHVNNIFSKMKVSSRKEILDIDLG